MSQPILTTASGSGISDPNHSLSARRPPSASAQRVLTRKLGLGGPMGARQWIGLALNVGGLAVVLQSLARHGVGA